VNDYITFFPRSTHGWIRLPSVATDRNQWLELGIKRSREKYYGEEKKKKKKVCSTLSFWLLPLSLCVYVQWSAVRECLPLLLGIIIIRCRSASMPTDEYFHPVTPFFSHWTEAKATGVSISFTRQPICLLHFNNQNSRQIASSLNGWEWAREREREEKSKNKNWSRTHNNRKWWNKPARLKLQENAVVSRWRVCFCFPARAIPVLPPKGEL